jgi:hypothetical protein
MLVLDRGRISILSLFPFFPFPSLRFFPSLGLPVIPSPFPFPFLSLFHFSNQLQRSSLRNKTTKPNMSSQPPPHGSDINITWAFLQQGIEQIMNRLEEGLTYKRYMEIYT